MEKPEFHDKFLNPNPDLPYGVTPESVKTAIKNTYQYYHELNQFHADRNYGRIETQIRATNALSDFIGNAVTTEMAKASPKLELNQKPDGFPDLLPADDPQCKAADYYMQTHDEGIETKCSISDGAWEAHNIRPGWFMVFRYERGDPDALAEEMDDIEFVQVLAANLDEDDWNDNPSEDHQDRTNTAHTIKSGTHKLRSNPVYEDPDYIHGYQYRKEEYREYHAKFNDEFAENNPKYKTTQTNLTDL